MISLVNLKKTYGQEIVLENLNYTFKNGKTYGLIGKNGAGKTTLLKTISRLISDNEGSIFIDEQCIDKKDYFKVPISYITDTPTYYTDLTVKEHLLVICYSQKYSKALALKKIDALLENMKLRQYQNSFPGTLSRGTLQRLNLAMGFLREEKIVLMDEPFTALDPVQVNIVEETIKALNKEEIIQIISSHDIDSLKSVCDIFLILKDGKLLEYKPSSLDKEKIVRMIKESYGE